MSSGSCVSLLERKHGAEDGKDKAAQSLGQRGGNARAKALSAKKRADIAKKAAAARWKRVNDCGVNGERF